MDVASADALSRVALCVELGPKLGIGSIAWKKAAWCAMEQLHDEIAVTAVRMGYLAVFQ